MSNFKSGSGNLEFGDGDTVEQQDESPTETETRPGRTGSSEPPSDRSSTDGNQSSSDATSEQSTQESSDDPEPADDYPYFVRRSNVGDERDTRLELHVRDTIAEQEAEFRNELADHLDTTDIAKTDAREFALLTAFQNPEYVAELMQEEGFGTLD